MISDKLRQTIVGVAGGLFTMLVAFGVFSPEQAGEANEAVVSTIESVSAAIIAVVTLVGVVFGPNGSKNE